MPIAPQFVDHSPLRLLRRRHTRLQFSKHLPTECVLPRKPWAPLFGAELANALEDQHDLGIRQTIEAVEDRAREVVYIFGRKPAQCHVLRIGMTAAALPLTMRSTSRAHASSAWRF